MFASFDPGVWSIPFAYLGSGLFVLTLMLLFAAAMLWRVSKRQPTVVKSVAILTLLADVSWMLVLVLELFGFGTHVTVESMQNLSILFANHRWLLSPLPVLLLKLATIILFVYREKIWDRHADEYRRVVSWSIWGSLAVILIMTLESTL